MHLSRSLSGLVALVLVAGCGSSTMSPYGGGNNNGGGNQSGGHTTSITLTGSYTFDPAIDTVTANSTVTWTWPTDGAITHNVTFEDGTHSPDQTTGTYQRTFAQTGTYRYRCTHHSTSFTNGTMIGTIVVR